MRRLHAWLIAGAGVLAATGFFVRPKTAAADGPNDATEKQERCATRLSGALLGRGPSAELFASTDPQSAVGKMLEDPQFQERFARYLNAHFNRAPGAKPSEDAPYYLAKLVLEQKLPYKELFVGAYDVSADDKGVVAVVFFGLPNNRTSARALSAVGAALAIDAELRALGRPYAIGIATGRSFCGLVGSPRRVHYTCHGDVPNLAARLMAHIEEGVVCDAYTERATRHEYEYRALHGVSIKGIEASAPAYLLLGARARHQ